MWNFRKHAVSIACNRSFGVRSKQFSEKVSLNIHHTIAGRRRFYKNVGVDEEEDTGLVCFNT
jgi:hypothetical protein